MSRKKKTRRLRDKLSVKTGSKKDFLAPGQKGQIPSKNKLAKHHRRTKSAYQKYLEEQDLPDTSGQGTASRETSTEAPEASTSSAPTARPDIRKRKPEALQPAAPEHEREFDEMTGDDLWNLLDKD